MDDIRRNQPKIEKARHEVAGSLAALAGEMNELVDVRAWVQREPLLFAGAAALVGFLLAQKPRAAAAVVGRLLPMAAMAALKPMMERIGNQIGGSLGTKLKPV